MKNKVMKVIRTKSNLTVAQARAALASVGWKLAVELGEWVIWPAGEREARYYTDSLSDAVATAQDIAARCAN